MTMRKIKLFLTALAVLISSAAFAQSLTVTGTVTDAATGEPVPFASIHEKGTMNGTNTDIDGNYSITVSPEGTIVFSSIGYNSLEIPVEGRAQINCDLEVDSETLDNAVVVGYGSAKKVGTMIGSVTTVRSDAIKNAPSSSALDQLQGQVAGLAVMTTGGVAGEDNVSMTLHGTGSLNGDSESAEPLYIIDGIQSSSRAVMTMNPNDILSISVLKDASATSIYGSRAANGVIVITTKSGGYDADATVTIRSQAGISTLADRTLYENMMTGPELKEFWIKTGIMSPQQIHDTYTSKGYDADTKWYNYYQQFNNPQFQNDVTIEGGGQKVAYMIGASQYHQRGTSIGNYYDRYTVRTNVQGRPKDWLKVGGNISLSYDETMSNQNWNGASQNGSSLYTSGGGSYLNNPLFPAIDPATGEEYAEFYPDGQMNQRWFVENYYSRNHGYNLLGSFNVEIEPIRNLKIASRAGVDATLTLADVVRIPSWSPSEGNGAKLRAEEINYAATLTNTIEYSFNVANDHQFTVLAGQEGIINTYDGFQASSAGITDDRLTNLQNGTQDTYSVAEAFSQSKFLSFFGRIDYALQNKYYFDASVRNDASSRFGPKNRNATFWAVGGMWKMKYEDFMQNAYWLNDLNLKVSYGTQGNSAIGDYQHLALLGASGKYATGTSMIVSQPSNPELTWEQQALLTVGINGRAYDRFDFNIEFYNRQTSNMLMGVPYNYTTGFPTLRANVGGLRNTGIDLTLGVDILRGRDYFLRAQTTFNFNDERVTELFNGLERWEMVDYGLAYVVGKPVMFYAPIYAGVDPEDGAPMWYLPGENIDVTTKEATTKTYDMASLNQNTGKRYNAPVNGGFNISGGWRNFALQADFSYVLGKTLVNLDGWFYANPVANSDVTQHRTVQDYWTPENRYAQWPDWTQGHEMQSDTHLYENADFLRLKNLQVAYTFPSRLLGNQQVLKGLKLSFTGRNLFILTQFTGIDPEVASNGTMGRVGSSKQFLFGVELTF